MKRCVIIGAGELHDLADIRRRIRPDDTVICADGGYTYAKQMGVQPALLLGDFDSLQGELPQDVEIVRVPSEKDDSDTMLAIRVALEKQFTEILLLGMLGGRLDHTLANIQALLYIARHGAKGFIESEEYTITVIENDEMVLPCHEGKMFSLFSLGNECLGVDIEHAKYLLKDASLTNDNPIGLSNQFLDEPVTVRVQEGALVVLIHQ